MASSTPSAPINSSPWRREYDRRPDLLFHYVRAGSSPRRRPRLPPPHFCSHYTTTGEKNSVGGKTIRRRNNYPERRQVPKNSKKIRKMSHSAENNLFKIFIHWTELYPIFIQWPELHPIFIQWADLYPILIHWADLYPILLHWAELYPILIH